LQVRHPVLVFGLNALTRSGLGRVIVVSIEGMIVVRRMVAEWVCEVLT
jgi:hypothetical protein